MNALALNTVLLVRWELIAIIRFETRPTDIVMTQKATYKWEGKGSPELVVALHRSR